MCDVEESIYKLIPEPKMVKPKSAMYRSKYSHDSPVNSSFGKKTNGALPPRNSDQPRPDRFLKKGSKTSTPTKPQQTNFKYGERRKPPVVTRQEAPKLTPKKKENFVKRNQKVAVQEGLKRRQAPQEDQDFTKKADFGKVPAYLSDVKQEISQEREKVRKQMEQTREEQDRRKPQTMVLPEEERQNLLQALQKRWDAVNKDYQYMTHMVQLDTQTKIRKKERLEGELTDLEKAMDKLSRKLVFVQNDA